MSTKKYFLNPFSHLFRNSIKKAIAFPIIFFLFLFLQTLNDYSYIQDMLVERSPSDGAYVGEMSQYLGYFWGDFFNAEIVTLFLAAGGVFTALCLFYFASSKKQCNVIFSLGLSRRKIFLAKYTAGLVPFFIAILIAVFSEIVCVCSSGFALNRLIIEMALYYTMTFLSVYTLSFTIAAAAFAFSGNVIEGTIFTAIIGVSPLVAGLFYDDMKQFYTLGATYVRKYTWSFFDPYFFFGNIERNAECGGREFILEYFKKYSDGSQFYKFTLSDFSGAIMAFVYAAVIFTVAFIMFKHRKNEIAGSFGRAKGLNQICGILVGFYFVKFFFFVLMDDGQYKGEGNFILFLLMVLMFALAYFAFRMVFGHKRRQALKHMFKTVCTCGAALGIATVIFSTGLFGYSSKVPDAEDVASIDFSTELVNPYSVYGYDSYIAREATYGYVSLMRHTSLKSGNSYDLFFDMGLYFENVYDEKNVSDREEIEKLIAIHKSFVQNGKIKNTASDACGINFEITYHLKDGRELTRYYTETSEENAKRILGLSNFDVIKEDIAENLFNYDAEETEASYGVDSEDGNIAEASDSEQKPTETKTARQFYIRSKDLKGLYSCGEITPELKKAIVTDLTNQSAEDVFFHKAEDEIGIISIGSALNADRYKWLGDDEYFDEDGNVVDTTTNKIIMTRNEMIEQFKVSDNKYDKGFSFASYNYEYSNILITKDMKNTIKYLTDKGLMKYFKSEITANDVKMIKLGSKAEVRGRENSDMLPLFACGYSNASEVKLFDDRAKAGMRYDDHYFAEHVDNEITNKSAIQKVLDNSFLYGFCSNADRVVEVTFNDGSIATYCVRSDVLKDFMK